MIKKIALTGGPCGGKTTSIQKIIEEFEEKGFKVFVVPEAATLLINMGIRPFGKDALSLMDFQKLVLETGIKLEEFAVRSACKLDSDSLILCDRGALDIKAYINNEEWKELLEQYKLKETTLINNYDLVIHLRSTAVDKEEFYTLDNNTARTETVEEAREKDYLTLNSWLGHPKLKIIGNNTDFEGKINNVIKEVYEITNKPYPIQRQYKFLVNSINNYELMKQDLVILDIEQYVIENDDEEIILRKTVKDNEESFKMITKIDTNINNERIVKERKISEEEYYSSIPTGKKPIKKRRFCFEYNNQYFRFDSFDNSLMILEIESTDESIIDIPSFIEVTSDISNNINYRNSNIYKNINNIKKTLNNE